MRVAAGSATSTNISFGQSLETNAVIRLAGKVVNLSFYYRVNTNFSTAFTVTPVYTTGTDANISTVPNGTAIGSSQTVTNTTSWTRFSYSFTIPSNATSFAVQFWNNGNTVPTASLDITGVQLEEGSVATPFEFEDISATIAKCQRYYEWGVASGSGYAQITAIFDAGSTSNIDFKVSKRAVPTMTNMTLSGNQYPNNQANSVPRYENGHTREFRYTTVNNTAFWNVTTGNGGSTGVAGHQIIWNASAEL
jgi:hypothetical protein